MKEKEEKSSHSLMFQRLLPVRPSETTLWAYDERRSSFHYMTSLTVTLVNTHQERWLSLSVL